MSQRSNRADVRNPLVLLPAARDLCNLDPAARECWRKHKAPMAAYWKAVAVYANHASRLFRPIP